MRRLYNAVCGWLEADAEARLRDEPEHPEGSTADTERSRPGRTIPEMHREYRGTELEDDGGEYRRRFGFNNDHTRH